MQRFSNLFGSFGSCVIFALCTTAALAAPPTQEVHASVGYIKPSTGVSNPPPCATNAAAVPSPAIPFPPAPSDSNAAAGLTNFIVTTNNDIGVYRKVGLCSNEFRTASEILQAGCRPPDPDPHRCSSAIRPHHQ
jgi:hypothetical protein